MRVNLSKRTEDPRINALEFALLDQRYTTSSAISAINDLVDRLNALYDYLGLEFKNIPSQKVVALKS